jgi:hypothetical protein
VCIDDLWLIENTDPHVNRDPNSVSAHRRWLLMRPSCTRKDFLAAWELSERCGLKMQIDLKVLCNANQMLRVGADGTVQLCCATFELGNLHQESLRNMLLGAVHRQAARDACESNCPNCHCGYDTRVLKHGPSLARYRPDHA